MPADARTHNQSPLAAEEAGRKGSRAPLYVRLLGDRWEELPEGLKRAHAGVAVRAVGRFQVRGAPGRIAAVARRLLRLPSPGVGVDVLLRITPRGESERWNRLIGGRRIISMQHGRDGLLVERFGLIEFVLRVTVRRGGMQFRQILARIACGPLRVRLPRSLAPVVVASVRSAPKPDCMHVRVQLAAPRLGRVLRYKGAVRIVEARP